MEKTIKNMLRMLVLIFLMILINIWLAYYLNIKIDEVKTDTGRNYKNILEIKK